MNASGTAATGDAVALDPQNPWLGLFSYTEETRAYFHGRDTETAELARRVQSKNLTILFGQSGLGKTSLLRAGLVPRLRPLGYCPVYVRIDYAPTSPSPAQQIRQAIFKATTTAGVWTRPGASAEGESLWELLHHRGDLLRDAAGKPLLPLLIFDQFEEIFTLGQADDAGRDRAKAFLADLADLAENRPPEAFERRLEEDDSLAGEFDFERADYRVLITLREDYLAYLESLKGTMPSITQNRMRLARMTGGQALDAVVKPGGGLVSQEVAEAIVRFVAGGSELANAEIEPSLLSLVCRELNGARLAQHRNEISADLLAGSRNTILSEFYERSLADQPEGVRRVVEDELLTDSGYRESLAEERVRKLLDDAGAAPDTLATLVNRRLLRIEDRLDMRRVELTHDVLCGVVLASRNARKEREARAAAEQQLVEQKAREEAAHRALVRARLVATVCAVLLVFALAAAAFGFWSLHRARSAEARAQQSRADAEKLVSFLIEDLYADLAPTGRAEVLGKLAQKTVAYYDTLPPQFVTRQTRINRAMAQVREASAQQAGGDIKAADKGFAEAQATFRQLYEAGDHGEPVVYGLALALMSQGKNAVMTGTGQGTVAQLKQAIDLLRPLAHAKGATRQVRLLYADTLGYWLIMQPVAEQLPITEEALQLLAGLGALDLSDLEAAMLYADTLDSRARALVAVGRVGEGRKIEPEVYELADKVLARQPGNLRALTVRYYASQLLGALAGLQHDPATALDWGQKTVQAAEDRVRTDPSDMSAWNTWVIAYYSLAQMQLDSGAISQGIATLKAAFALADDPRLPSSLAPALGYGGYRCSMAVLLVGTGDPAGAKRALAGCRHDVDAAIAQLPPKDPRRSLLIGVGNDGEAALKLAEGHSRQALEMDVAELHRLEALDPPAGSAGASLRDSLMYTNLARAVFAALLLGDYPQAEAFARRLQQVPQATSNYGSDPREEPSAQAVFLAWAVAGQGRFDEAAKILAPALAFYREQQKGGATGVTFRRRLAQALYADSLIAAGDPAGAARRKADLAEAAKLIDTAPAGARNAWLQRRTRSLIAAAQQQAD